MIDRPKFNELIKEDIDKDGPENYDLVQLKMDGIWGCMVVKDGQWSMYSRTGKLKADGDLEEHANLDVILLGEYMIGSHWGHKMGIDGEYFVFDCVRFNGEDIKHEPYANRKRLAESVVTGLLPQIMDSTWIHTLATFESHEWQEVWETYVVGKGYEGLVFKDSESSYSQKNAWARLKTVVELEYICHSFRPADEGTRYEGQVGAVIGTLNDKEVFVTCGGLTDKQRREYTDNGEDYIGKVFTAKGNGWYPSGSIRHPKFKGWRDDKEANECSIEQIPSTMR